MLVDQLLFKLIVIALICVVPYLRILIHCTHACSLRISCQVHVTIQSSHTIRSEMFHCTAWSTCRWILRELIGAMVLFKLIQSALSIS